MAKLIQNARLIVVDTNLNQEVIQYIAETYKDKALYLDTVSVAKAEKAKSCIGSFSTIKPNRYELEVLTGIKADTEEGLIKKLPCFDRTRRKRNVCFAWRRRFISWY